jgi:hypothetical protein
VYSPTYTHYSNTLILYIVFTIILIIILINIMYNIINNTNKNHILQKNIYTQIQSNKMQNTNRFITSSEIKMIPMISSKSLNTNDINHCCIQCNNSKYIIHHGIALLSIAPKLRPKKCICIN